MKTKICRKCFYSKAYEGQKNTCASYNLRCTKKNSPNSKLPMECRYVKQCNNFKKTLK